MLLTELKHELTTRDTFTEKFQYNKRRSLGRLLVKEKERGIDPRAIRIQTFDFATEKSENELAWTENLIWHFDGATTDSCFRRASSSLNHIILRNQRIPVDNLSGENLLNQDETVKSKSEAYA